MLEECWRVRPLDRIKSIGYQALEVRGEVTGKEVDLTCQLNVLLVQVVAVEAL